MGGSHSNAARNGLSSHFAWAMGALVWRSPTAFELCNSHRAEQPCGVIVGVCCFPPEQHSAASAALAGRPRVVARPANYCAT